MKKKIIFVCMILFLFVLMGNSRMQENGIRLKDYSQAAALWEKLTLSAERELGEIVLLPHTPFDEKEAAQIITRLDRLPQSLLTKMRHKGIMIQLFTGKLTEQPPVVHLAGKMPRGHTNTLWDDLPGIGGGKMVFVKIGASEKGNGHGSVNLELHELAHSIERHIWNELRYNSDFIAIWQKEKESLFPEKQYFLSYPEEYFAECFAYYFLEASYREELRMKAPLTFTFIQTLLKS